MKRLYRRHGELVNLLLLGTATKKQKRELRGIRNRIDDLERWRYEIGFRHLRREMKRATRASKKLLAFVPKVIPLYAEFGVAT